MTVKAIVGLFVLRIVFNIFLPSFDIYSDATLAYNTFTFNLGESLLLAGCRVCQGKDETELYTLRNKSYQTCLASPESVTNTVCGLSHEVLNAIHESERKDKCGNENLSFTLNKIITKKAYVINNEKCDFSKEKSDESFQVCCFKSINQWW